MREKRSIHLRPKIRFSAGILLYDQPVKELRVLLGHIGGTLWERIEVGAWTISKGKLADGGSVFDAALREFEEEVRLRPQGNFIPLTTDIEKSGKCVHMWAVQGAFDPVKIRSSITSVEWPAGYGRMVHFPELDSAKWFSLEDAAKMAVKKQVLFSEELYWELLN